MSSPFEPFTPADGGRRAQEWDWREQEYQAQDPWAQPQQYHEPQYQQPDYRYQQQPQYQYQEPSYQAPPPRERKSRYKPILFGLVAALVLVSGWQAFRVESLLQNSNALRETVNSS